MALAHSIIGFSKLRHSSMFRAAIFLIASVSLTVTAENITEQVFGSYNKFMPAAFADFNSDKHTDVIVIEDDSKGCNVRVLLSYVDPPLLRPDGPVCPCPGGNVRSVVPGDFDGDGALDLLLLSHSSGKLYDVYVAWGDLKNMTCPTEVDKMITVSGQPLMMDYNGDMIADLFGESANNTRSFWLFSAERTEPDQLIMTSPTDTPLKPLRVPSSHGFVDLDGDLAADLFVTAEGQFEVWTNTGTGFFLTETIAIPDNVKVVGQTAFMDISLRGHNDIVCVMCSELDCSDGQVFVYTTTKDSDEKKFVSVGFPLLDGNSKSWSYPTTTHHSYPYTDTISLRTADYDLDGYPDILLTLLDSDDNPQALLASNRECSDTSCSEYPRRLVPDWELLKGYPNSVLAAFFDVFEDGRMDVLLLQKQGTEYAAAAVTDTQQYDAMFLKVLVPSGRCYSECPHHSLPYGSSPAGPTFRYTITTADRGMQVSVATQLSQSAHMALQLPYTLFGLGRNWNFVETLQVGLPVKDSPVINYSLYKNNSLLASPTLKFDQVGSTNIDGRDFPAVRNFTQIIPNSQVIVFPYPLDQPGLWVNKLYITPSKALRLTATALVAVCLLVACVIGVLHYREKKEDRKEKLQQAQSFHFDAM